MKNNFLKIKRAPSIQGEITVPGDKSISHRSVILAGLSNGTCLITGFLPSEDCLCTVNAMSSLGIEIEQPEPTTLIVHGRKRQLSAPKGDIYCGNSGTTMRLMAGLLSAQPFRSRLVGDPSLSKRPMKRIIEPLSKMGAKITAEGPGNTPPLVIDGFRLNQSDMISLLRALRSRVRSSWRDFSPKAKQQSLNRARVAITRNGC